MSGAENLTSLNVAFAAGEPVPTVAADRGEANELAEILKEFGHDEVWLEEELDRRCGERAADMLRMALYEVMFPKPGTTREEAIVVISYVVGLAGLPTMSNASKEFNINGMSKQTLSGRCKRLCKELSLPPSIYMKSEAASNTYRHTNKRRRA